MKTSTALSLGMAGILSAAPLATFAQTPATSSAPATAPVAAQVSANEGIILENGGAFVLRGGQRVRLEREMTLSDGTRISSGGVVTAADGKARTIAAGQMLTLDGRLAALPADSSSSGSGRATGTVTTGPATGSVSTGRATGTTTTGPATGTSTTGAATGTSSTGPATGTTSTGPARGTPTTGPSTGTPSSGRATGTPSTGPASGSGGTSGTAQ